MVFRITKDTELSGVIREHTLGMMTPTVISEQWIGLKQVGKRVRKDIGRKLRAQRGIQLCIV